MLRYPLLTLTILGLLILGAAACGGAASRTQILRLATTTSTDDSGLLTAILPDFEARYGIEVEVVAVGTGQALALGEAGDADVLLVHAPAREKAFVAQGHGTTRHDVMYNDFVLVGPPDDPASIRGLERAAAALSAIAAAEAPWASRGDESGTHSKERSLWEAAGIEPDSSANWYNSLGQGMGATLTFADEVGAYTLTDRGTFLARNSAGAEPSGGLSNLVVMVGGDSTDANPDPMLYNPYAVIPVNPEKSNAINHELAVQFVAWLTSIETQRRIAAFGIEKFGQPLFYPNSEAWRATER